jgi:hypothetical protein
MPISDDASQDLVDVFYVDLVRPLGNLVILFAQAEASLLAMISALKRVGERQAQEVFKAPDAKEQIIALVASSGLQGSELAELSDRIGQYWSDKETRNRYFHDNWFVVIAEEGFPATRGLPLKKGATVKFGDPTAQDVWNLAASFRAHKGHFNHVVWQRSRDLQADFKVNHMNS